MYVGLFAVVVMAVVAVLITAPDIKYAKGRNVKKLVERTEELYRPSHIYFPRPFKTRLARYFEDRWPSGSAAGKKDAYNAYQADSCLLYAVVHVAYEIMLTRGFCGTDLTTAGCSTEFCDEVFSVAVKKLEEMGFDLSCYTKNYRKHTRETEAFFEAHPLGFRLEG